MSQIVTFNSLVGYELETERGKRNLDQAVLAQRCGMSQPVLSRLEKGKATIGIDQLFIICQELDISVAEIMARVENSVESIQRDGSVHIKTTKEIGSGAALLTGAAIGAVLTMLLSKK